MIKNTTSTVATLLAAGFLSLAQLASAGDTATQTVTFAVAPINEIAVSGNPGSLIVSTATAGQAPSVAVDSSSTYAITTNETDRKISGSINSAMPNGVTLSVTLAPPTTTGSSTGKQELSTTAIDLVTGITALNESGRPITYELSATSAAGVVSSASKTVTFTVTAGS